MNNLRQADQNPCMICYENFNPEIIDEVTLHKNEAQSHQIHLSCLNSWLGISNSDAQGVRKVGDCPLCNRNIEPMDIKVGSKEFNDIRMDSSFTKTIRSACDELRRISNQTVMKILNSEVRGDLLQYADRGLEEPLRANVIQWAIDLGYINIAVRYFQGGPISQKSLDALALSAVINSQVMLAKMFFEKQDENSWIDNSILSKTVSEEAYGNALEVAMNRYPVNIFREPDYKDHEAIFQFLTEVDRVSFYFPKISLLTFRKLLVSATKTGCFVVAKGLLNSESQSLTEETYSLALEASFQKLDSQKERQEIHSLLVDAGSNYPSEFSRIRLKYSSQSDSSSNSQEALIGGAGSLAQSTSSSSSSSSSYESFLGRRPREVENSSSSSSSSSSEPAEEPSSPSLERETQRQRIG